LVAETTEKGASLRNVW